LADLHAKRFQVPDGSLACWMPADGLFMSFFAS